MWDTKVPALAYRVRASGAAAFYFVRRINRRFKRVQIGGAAEVTIEQARRLAAKYNGEAAQGIDPTAARRAERAASTTLEQLWTAFRDDREHSRKATTLDGYGKTLDHAFAEWLKRPVRDLTPEVVLALHRRLGKASGHAYANLSMRTLSSLMGFAVRRGLAVSNPVDVLRREWFKVKPRKTHIADEQLGDWFAAVEKVRADNTTPVAAVGADYLEFTLLTGLRRNEAAKLTWDRVDLDKKTVTIQDTKNSDPLVLPLADYTAAILERRKAESASEYVFPSPGTKGKGKPIGEPRYCADLVAKAGGCKTTTHDLRRTFISAAVRLVPYAVVKTLVNHRAIHKGDITLDYASLDVEGLRPHVQKIADFFLAAPPTAGEAEKVRDAQQDVKAVESRD